jgi:hypothetical protein
LPLFSAAKIVLFRSFLFCTFPPAKNRSETAAEYQPHGEPGRLALLKGLSRSLAAEHFFRALK